MAKKGQKIIKPGKEITASNVNTLEKKIVQLPEGSVKEIILDLSKVESMDAVGLGFILAAHNTMAGLNGRLQLINVPEKIHDLFHTMGIDQHVATDAA